MAEHPYEDVAARLVRVVDWESLNIPPGHGVLRSFRSMAKQFRFDSTRDLGVLLSVLPSLCVYGFLDRAAEASVVLGEVAYGTPNVMYGYIGESMACVACFCERSGRGDLVDRVLPVLLNTPGKPYRPLPRALDGSMLKDLFSHPDCDPIVYPGWAFSDIVTLSTMWVFGSPSREWSRERIGATIDANVAVLHGLPKWRAW